MALRTNLCDYSNHELLSLAKSGDVKAWTVLYDKKRPYVAEVLRRAGAAMSQMEDLLQDLYLKAWNKLEQLRGGAQVLSGWLAAMARNLVTDQHKQANREVSLVDDEPSKEDLRRPRQHKPGALSYTPNDRSDYLVARQIIDAEPLGLLYRMNIEMGYSWQEIAAWLKANGCEVRGASLRSIAYRTVPCPRREFGFKPLSKALG